MNNIVPVYLIARNLLTPLLAMIEYLQRIPRVMIVIVDNDSTYLPLLDWYDYEFPDKVVRTGINGGPQSWAQHMLNHQRLGITHYVVTDSDLDLAGVPLDVLDVLEEGLRRFPGRLKCGLSLAIDDIPDEYPLVDDVRQWESQFWMRPLDGDASFFDADIDTTFAMRRSCDEPAINTGHSIRTGHPYTARHVPWYWAAKTMTDEDRYYLQHATAPGICWSAKMRELLNG